MPWSMTDADLSDLEVGLSILGGGGGGDPRTARPLARPGWRREIFGFEDLDPDTVCIAVGISGSTMVHSERLLDPDAFGVAIAAVERWTGRPVQAICNTECAGVNGMLTLVAEPALPLVDADLMGRALPGLNQFSLVVDGLDPVAATVTGAGGVLLVDGSRPEEFERILRGGFEAGVGFAPLALGAFPLAFLADHVIQGTLGRALTLGRKWRAATELGPELLAELGGRWLGHGRVTAIANQREQRTRLVTLGGVHSQLRVVARDEYVACLRDGLVVARAPDIIVMADLSTRSLVPVDRLRTGQHLAVASLPVAEWWYQRPSRLASVLPSHYGLAGLDEVEDPT